MSGRSPNLHQTVGFSSYAALGVPAYCVHGELAYLILKDSEGALGLIASRLTFRRVNTQLFMQGKRSELLLGLGALLAFFFDFVDLIL